ncbi:modifier of mdg4 isoform X8 [Condylostylus longicornis]|uniref:modifier of mdg4 isoform X8 n=1 Tax=Condylostylus longicornis TaxID=2530218 RepID=UPI00244DCFC3|nr:modifier of mdg4 isoform X8 [Condylostylus longicornis]
MADDEQFSLCWNNFNSNLSAGFHESLCRGDLVDVTLAAEGQFIKAHRLVLSVCSPYFRKMFTQMPTNQHAFVFLKDVSHSALKDLIQFMYCGEVNVKQDALPAFISTAEALQIKGLTDGDPAPSQSPAKPSTPAPQQIPAQAQQTVTTSLPRPKARTRTQAQTQQYKIETDDSDVEKATQIVIQTSTAPLTTSTPQTIQVQVQTTQQQQQTQTQQQTQQHQTQTVQIQPQTVVSAQKRVAQKSITPHTVKRTKLVQQPDPLEASEPTQITVQTVTESKTNNETEFIDLPIELPTKSEPEYAEDAGGDVETVEQEATYVEDDSYGDMKYDESYFTENDETGANVGGSGTGTAVQATTSTIKQQQPSFSESYVSDAGDQSATEAQDHKKKIFCKEVLEPILLKKLSCKTSIPTFNQSLLLSQRTRPLFPNIKPIQLGAAIKETFIVSVGKNGHALAKIPTKIGCCVECLKKSAGTRKNRVKTFCAQCPNGEWMCENCFIDLHNKCEC